MNGVTLIVFMLLVTALMRNVALIALLVAIFAETTIGMNIPVLYLLTPITMANSYACMLPMKTPPNAIVSASGHIRVRRMARVGVLINTVAIVLRILLFQFFIPLFFLI
jgi:sodium-dependent dicarboxylate transporter 2/3/5